MRGFAVALLLALAATSPRRATAQPAPGDQTAGPLLAYQQVLLAPWQGDYRRMPLAAKADYFDWELWRYHLNPLEQVSNRVILPAEPGQPPLDVPGSDTSTWNGALLAALAYQYAVTRQPETLAHIETLLRGLHRYQEITGASGLLCRSMCLADNPRGADLTAATDASGRELRYRGDPAKGTYNQVAAGYATLLALVGDDLTEASRRLARDDLAALALHLIDHDYRVTGADGRPTSYGDLTPVVAGVGVPFNAQVAYQIVAAARTFPPDDPAQRARLESAFSYLRHRHHAYYANPWRSLVQPQKVAASPFIKGMNDKFHVHTAAFVGLRLEEFAAARDARAVERDFQHQLGQTMFWTMDAIGGERNALANFMWAAIAADPAAFETIVEHKRNTARGRLEAGLLEGVEQLRRFPLNRFIYAGQESELPDVQWAEAYRPDDFRWKCNPRAVWTITGPMTGEIYCAIDYLYAYWLMRYFKLDESPPVKERFGALLER